jgi:peptidoglycan hydrolase-like protein with peptidoglycan-binding domain
MGAEKQIALVRGLDHVTYEGYQPGLVKKVQNTLKADGLYQGQINGALDKPTMKAIGEFQRTHHLEMSGIPTPRTRKELLKG